ncbi:putative VP2 [Microviridae sp.]|nr:putative VP2 [Microviridae sp.]
MYSLLSRKQRTAFFKKARKMGVFDIATKSFNAVGGNLIGMGLNWIDERLNGERRRRKQLEQEGKLAEQNAKINFGYNKQLMDIQNQNTLGMNRELMDMQLRNQQNMWDYTAIDKQLEKVKNAGLNPALLYGAGAGGGGVTGTVSTSGSASPAGNMTGNRATADSEMEQKQAEIQEKGMALQLGLQKAQIENMEADTEKKKAEAINTGASTELTKAQTLTENELRAFRKEFTKQEGMEKWLENARKQYENSYADNKNEGGRAEYNATYDWWSEIESDSPYAKNLANNIFKSLAEIKKLDADSLLSNTKAQGYWKELLIAQQKADSEAVKAAAIKLSTQWETGDYTNWKTWTKLGTDALGAVGDLLKIKIKK